MYNIHDAQSLMAKGVAVTHDTLNGLSIYYDRWGNVKDAQGLTYSMAEFWHFRWSDLMSEGWRKVETENG